MGGMDAPRYSRYRGWTIGLAANGRRKWLAHGARKRPPHKLVMAEGWGERLVLAELHRKIDRVEAELAADAATSPG